MNRYLEKSEKLRNSAERHYNCAQGVLVPFAEGAGIDDETAAKITSNFGSGMRIASVCGAVTGGLMVLGLYGADDMESTSEYFRRIKENHKGFVNCSDLLRLNKEEGGDKKAHCDAMVYECVETAYDILKKKGIIE